VRAARARRVLWIAGWPVRFSLLTLVRLYRLTLGQVIGGGCRFYPSCSAYAEQAIGELGAIRGTALTVWRVLRCSPLSKGGVDHPPTRSTYDTDIHDRVAQRISP
jgi:putative membrane protein insertion efficiency factor